MAPYYGSVLYGSVLVYIMAPYYCSVRRTSLYYGSVLLLCKPAPLANLTVTGFGMYWIVYSMKVPYRVACSM